MNEHNPELVSVRRMTQEFQTRWNRLISSTNWEKGRIIRQWRDTILAEGGSMGDCSDEAWSRLVCGVTPQHVGRLRRVHERFSETHDQFTGLYWSHFLAALDWEDAEMWLEGAVQNSWSVSQMRSQRWETLGSIPDQRPREEEIVASETDEDAETADGDLMQERGEASLQTGAEVAELASPEAGESEAAVEGNAVAAAGDIVGPFEGVPALPDDLTEALEAFKLAILRHRMNNWSGVSPQDVLASLEGLKRLVLAPADSTAAPF